MANTIIAGIINRQNREKRLLKRQYVLVCLMLLLFLFSPFGGAGGLLHAQQYPVQGSLAIAPPYPAYLSDYANSGINKLYLTLTFTDITLADKRIRLKLTVQTQNAVVAQSVDNVMGEPVIILNGGMPQQLTGIQLAPYFKYENLQGLSPDAYAQPLSEAVTCAGDEKQFATAL